MRTRDTALYAAETVLYLTFMGMDLLGAGNTTPVKFASILLLALSVLDLREKPVSFALFLTAAADLFLLVLDRCYAAGILCFLAVQALYAVRMHRSAAEAGTARYRLYILLPAAGAVLGTLAGRGQLSGLTQALAGWYILLFAANVLNAVLLARGTEERRWKLFAAGLVLFFCCDLCVGVHNLPQIGGPALHRFAAVAMWGFYLPGQVLIRASAYVRPSGVPLSKG